MSTDISYYSFNKQLADQMWEVFYTKPALTEKDKLRIPEITQKIERLEAEYASARQPDLFNNNAKPKDDIKNTTKEIEQLKEELRRITLFPVNGDMPIFQYCMDNFLDEPFIDETAAIYNLIDIDLELGGGPINDKSELQPNSEFITRFNGEDYEEHESMLKERAKKHLERMWTIPEFSYLFSYAS